MESTTLRPGSAGPRCRSRRSRGRRRPSRRALLPGCRAGASRRCTQRPPCRCGRRTDSPPPASAGIVLVTPARRSPGCATSGAFEVMPLRLNHDSYTGQVRRAAHAGRMPVAWSMFSLTTAGVNGSFDCCARRIVSWISPAGTPVTSCSSMMIALQRSVQLGWSP